MRPAEPSAGAWIRPRLTSWATVTGFVPSGYEAYVRVLHPVDGAGTQITRWRDVAATTGRTVHPLVQWWRLIGSEDASNPSSDAWPGPNPDTGELAQPDNQTLLDLLAVHTDTPSDAYFALWLGYAEFNAGASVRFGIDANGNKYSEPAVVEPTAVRLAQGSALEHPGRSYGVLNGALTEAPAIPHLLGSFFPGPAANIVWPNDRSWCVATEVDFDSTLVACSAAAAESLLRSPYLETFPITPAGSLAHDADGVNID